MSVEHPGHFNSDAGPDFESAKIRIADSLWAGHIEIHCKEGDWKSHKHHLDARYNTTILHVVWERSKTSISRSDGSMLPTLVLQEYVDLTMLERYGMLMRNLSWIPCQYGLHEVAGLTKIQCLDRMLVERLEVKMHYILDLLAKTKQNWEHVMLLLLGRSFGAKVNQSAFEELVFKVKPQWLQKFRNDDTRIEALLFGLSGLLVGQANDDYPKMLAQEYEYMKKLLHLEPMRPEAWRFLRMRPYNFPTIRLGQLSALLCYDSCWFGRVRAEENLHVLLHSLRHCRIHSYWSTHFRFDKSANKSCNVGLADGFLYSLVLNCFIPILFSFGKFYDQPAYCHKALRWLTEVPPERNNIVSAFNVAGIKAYTAADTQALLHLKKYYCDKKQCLGCVIGHAILRTS